MTATVVAVWVYYPLSLSRLTDRVTELEYHVRLPAMLLLSYLAGSVVLLNLLSGRFPPVLQGILAIGVVSVIIGCAANGSTLVDVVWATAPFLVPAAVAAAWHDSGFTLRASVLLSIAGFWGVNVLLALRFGVSHTLCANPNWLAAVLMSTAPWAGWAGIRCARAASGFLNMSQPKAKHLISTVALLWSIGVATGTLVILYISECRASLVAGVAVVVVWCLSASRMWIRIVGVGAVASGVAVLTLAASERVDRWYAADIRGPLWQSTVRMIGDAPLTGHGFGQFRQSFTKYKSDDIARRTVAAAVTSHPHNEFLFLAATFGIPAATAWLVLVCAGLQQFGNNVPWQLARVSALILLVHGCLDKSMAVSPASVLFPLFLGICLAESWCPSAGKREGFGRVAVIAGLLLSGLLAIPVMITAWSRLKCDQYRRDCDIAILHGEMSNDRTEADRLFRTAVQAAGRASATGFDVAHSEFVAGMLLSEDLGDPEGGLQHLLASLDEESDYGFAGYLYGRALIRRLMSNGGLADDASEWLAATDALRRSVGNHPCTTYVYEDLIRALVISGEYQEALKWNRELEALCLERAGYDAFIDGESPEERYLSWQATLSADQVNLDGFSPSILENLELAFLPDVAEFCAVFVTSRGYTDRDGWFWQQVAELRNGTTPVGTVRELFSQVEHLRCSAAQGQRRHWPADVWRRGSGSTSEVADCISFLARLAGFSPLIVPHEGDSLIVVRSPSELGVYRASDATAILRTFSSERVSPDDWMELLQSEFDVSVTCSDDCRVFFYPSEFREVNHFLAACTAVDVESRELTVCPAAVRAQLKRAFGDFAPDTYSIDVFEAVRETLD